MKIPVRLMLRNITSHKIRSGLTIGCMAIAVILLCVLQSLIVALTAGVEASKAGRLIVQSAVSLYVGLPQSYQAKIDQIEGVEQSCKYQWFGGVYQDESNFFAQFGVDPDRLMQTYPEMKIVAGDFEEFTRDRRACVVGTGLMEKFDWDVGDLIPIIGTIFPHPDGGAWEFKIVAVYESESANFDNSQFFFDYKYLEETLLAQNTGTPEVGVFAVKLPEEADPVTVARQIDMLFENGPQRVQTTPEAEFQRQFVTMMGNIPMFLRSIGGGVIFAVFLGALNTMLLAARERTRDFGILKALGFRDGVAFLLLLAEGVLICLCGGLLGILIAKGSEDSLGFLKTMFPAYEVSTVTVLMGIVFSAVVGVLSALVPAWRLQQLKPVNAFRSEG